MSRPVIGITPLVDIQRESLWMLPGYVEGLRDAGALPLILPLEENTEGLEQLCGMCDGILFAGGQDVSPGLYGAERTGASGETCPERDRMEAGLLEIVLREGMPFLGICRGIQFINAALGGTLHQDLPSERPSMTEHHMSPPYDRAVHRVDIVPGTPLAGLIPEGRIGVNSYHHQAIRDLSPRLLPMAYSEDGLVEAVHCPETGFGWAVQWHPEFSFRSDPSSRAIFSAFVSAAAGFRNTSLSSRAPMR